MKIIINADDFGISSDINKAIICAFEDNLISSTTLMANMPGFEEACDLYYKHNLEGKVGIHLNISEGCPITKEITNASRFCDLEGKFVKQKSPHFIPSYKEYRLIEKELDAQLARVFKAGIRSTHIDSHQGYHSGYFTGKIVLNLAKKYSISDVHLYPNYGKMPVYKRIYGLVYNGRIRYWGKSSVAYFGSADSILDSNEIKEIARCTNTKKKLVEVMVHPGFQNGVLTDLTNDRPLREVIHDLSEHLGGFSAVSF